MLNLNERFRVVSYDKYNITFEEYREVEKRETKEKVLEWVKAGGYYGTLKQCLKALKDYIIQQAIQKEDLDVNGMFKLIDNINNTYINCYLSRNIYEKECDTDEDV